MLPAHGENIHLERVPLKCFWLMVVIFPVAQLFADARILRTEIPARRYQSEREVVYAVPCIRHVNYYPHRKPLEDVSCAGHR